MRKSHDDYFAATARWKKRDMSLEEKRQQLDRLHGNLIDWGLEVFSDVAFEWWINFEDHGILPYAGSWADQPRYVQRVLHRFSMLKRWHELNEELPSPEGLPTLKDLM